MRFYLSRTKQVEVDSLGPVNMHRLQELGVEFKGGGLRVGADGMLLHGYTVCAVEDRPEFAKDPELLPLDEKQAGREVEAKAALRAFGVDAEHVKDAATVEQMVDSLGKLNEDAFTVGKYAR